MKQTAVEWLQEQYNQCPRWEEQILEEDWEKAKEMEKQQIKNAYYTGGDDVEDNRDREAEQYYNETFKSE
jgi:hypothetical protein